MVTEKHIPVFIASPGDLAEERAIFKDAIDELNGGFGIGANVKFNPLGWEDTLALTGRRNQSVINHEIDRCEVFILCLNRRWGQEAPDSPYSSYTEEEFHRALERFNESGVPEIFVFFRSVDPGQEADPGPQLEKVMRFRRELEESRQVLYHYFDDKEGFHGEVTKHLIAYAKGDIPKVQEKTVTLFPLSAIEEIETAKKQAEEALKKSEQESERADQAYLRAEILQLDFAEEAAEAANDGKLETARQKFAKAVEGTTNVKVLYLAFSFYRRTGDLSLAETYLNRWLAISGSDSETSDTAAAYGNLGLIYETRGELEKAEDYYLKSLEIEESLGRKEGMANQYGNLGNIYETRGDLEKAEGYYLKSLGLNESLGRKEGMASVYGNLGIIYQTRGDLEKAEGYYLKSLGLNESLGRKEGMASDYGNLGVLYKTRGDLEKAEEAWSQSKRLFTEIGAVSMVEKVQSWIDGLKSSSES